jgi:hypothetical protein
MDICFRFSWQLKLKLPVQAFSTIDSNYTASFIVTTAQATAIQLAIGSDFKLQYSKQPTDITRGDFEDKNPFKGSGANTGINDGTDIDIPEINLKCSLSQSLLRLVS